MRNLRLSGIWAQIPWRRRKEEPEQSVSAKRRSNAPHRHEWRPFSRSRDDSLYTLAEDERPPTRQKTTRIWKDEDISESSPLRTLSASYRRFSRSFAVPDKQAHPVILEENGTETAGSPPAEESLIKRLRRKSQTFSLPRPRTSSGVPKRRSFWGGTADDEEARIPPMPEMSEDQQRNRSRHVPISIDYLQFPLEGDPIAGRQSIYDTGPGMAITNNEVQDIKKPFTERPRDRPNSFTNSFSQLRQRTSIFSSQRAVPESVSEASDDGQDIVTALPTLDTKDLRRATSNIALHTTQYSDSPYAPADRHVFHRATPKIVDILAPRPMSMISASATPRTRSRPSTADTTQPNSTAANRHKSMFAVPQTTMNDEDGPKGDWARTRHSWLGMDNEGNGGGSEQLEWEKLKQFIEAYSAGGDTSVVSIRQVDNSSESSASDQTKGGQKYSNARALAALEFGLN